MKFLIVDDAMKHFVKYPKTKRLGGKAANMMISEKLDGTNASITIKDGEIVCVASKNRPITPGKNSDNYGFAQWVLDNHDELLKLGEGYHPGEWCGPKIQDNPYNLEKRTWFIFNTFRPADSLPSCVKQVPLLYKGPFDMQCIQDVMNDLYHNKSSVTEGAIPEGVCIYHCGMRETFKDTFNYRDGKWGEK